MPIPHQKNLIYSRYLSLCGGSLVVDWILCRYFTPEEHNYIIVENCLTVNRRKFHKDCFTTIFHNFSLFSSKKCWKYQWRCILWPSCRREKYQNLCKNRSAQINSNQFNIELLALIESQFVSSSLFNQINSLSTRINRYNHKTTNYAAHEYYKIPSKNAF